MVASSGLVEVRMDRRVREVLERIEVEWRERCSVEALAASVNLCPSRLQHLFKTTVRASIRDVIRARRLAEAARLLLTTHERISTIAYSVGFRDASNFNHAFRKQYGVSPKAYRGRGGE